MARIEIIERSRPRKAGKPPLKCGRCGTEIPVGEGYKTWAFRYGGKHVRCMKPACHPRLSELISNEFQRALVGFEERASEAIDDFRRSDDLEGLIGEIESIASDLRDLGSEQQSKLENMPEGLQQGETGQLLETRASECDSKADELDSLLDELRSMEREEDEEDGDFVERIAEEVGGRVDFSID